jgi:hypothetical protein
MNSVKNGQRFTLSSKLSRDYVEDLERVFFLHPKQHRVREEVRKLIEQYGIPVLVKEGDYLAIRLEKYSSAQTLFMMTCE